MIPSVFDIIFPNRLVMIGICSACVASLAVIAAAPKFFDGAQEQSSSDRAGTQVFDGRPTAPRLVATSREREAEGAASERGVTRGLVPAPSSSPGGADGPNAIKPQEQFGQSTPSGPVTAPPGAVSVSSAATDNYVVQISAQRSKADAQASLRSLQAKFRKQLGDRKATVRRADLGPKGVYYRAIVGPFGSADDADRFCSSLQAAGGQCSVEKN
jgi:hypothetical protein